MDARADGMPAPILAERKRELVNQINEYIQLKKELGRYVVTPIDGYVHTPSHGPVVTPIGDAQAGKNTLLAGATQHETQNLQGGNFKSLP